MSLMKRFNKNKGQSLVETALVLPLIILILMGIIDFGMMFNNYLIVSNASREGARNAAVGASDAQVMEIVNQVSSTLDASKIVTEITPSEIQRRRGNEVTVTVKYQYQCLTPIISALMPDTFRLTGTAVMRIE